MATKPLTNAAIAMTEKKMDMTLDDIIKMSKTGSGTTKAKKQRVPNKNPKFLNGAVQDKSLKLRRFMDSRSSLRQGVLAQRRSSFQGNKFPLAAEAAKKAAVAPIHNRNFNQTRARTVYKPNRVVAPQVQIRAAQGGFDLKQQPQQVKVVSKQRPQTLDSLFANMKEQRMKFQGGRQHNRPRPPWGRYNN